MKEQQEKYNLPEGWVLASINELIDARTGLFKDGDWIETKDQDPKGEVRLIQLADIGDIVFRNRSYRFMNKNTAISLNCTFLKKGDILVARMPEPIGRTCIFPFEENEKYVTVVDVAVIRVGENSINNKLLMYFINSPVIRKRIEEFQTGTTRKRISRGNLSKILIPIPPLNEQNRIVLKLEEILSGLEKSKEQLEHSLNQLRSYKQSILKQAFEGKLTEEWRKNQNNLKTSQQIVNEINSYQEEQNKKELGDFSAGKSKIKPRKFKKILISSEVKALAKLKLPNEWLYIQLKNVCHTVERVSLKERKSDDLFIYLDIGGVNNNKNIIETYKEYQWKNAPSRAQNIVRVNDILFSSVRTYLKKIAMIEEEKFNHQIASSGFAVIRVHDNFISPKYIFKYVISDSFIQPLNDLQSGSSYPAVRNSDVFDQFIPICSIEEQIVISEELDRQFSIINHFENTIEKNLLKIESLKQSVLRKAFEGKLSEQDSNDEPVRSLLERIKLEKEDYLKREKEKPKNIPKIKVMSEKSKSILEILNENIEPITSKQLWLSSDKKDDIEEFYAELKKYIESGDIIELPRNGKESLLKLANKS